LCLTAPDRKPVGPPGLRMPENLVTHKSHQIRNRLDRPLELEKIPAFPSGTTCRPRAAPDLFESLQDCRKDAETNPVMTTTQTADGLRTWMTDVARKIDALAKSDVREEHFFQKFLEQLVAAIDARAGAVWMLDQMGMLAMYSDVRYAELALGDDAVSDRVNTQRLIDVVQQGRAAIHSRDDDSGDERSQPHVIQAPLKYQKRTIGVVELFFKPDVDEAVVLEQLQFVEEMAGYVDRYLEWREEAGSAAKHLEFWNEFEQFVLQMQRSLNPAEVAAAAANDGRQLLGCDRLSIALKHGPKTLIRSVSGQDRVNHRSNLVRVMTAVSQKAIEAGHPVVYSGQLDDIPPQLEGPLADFSKESGSRMINIIPLRQPKPLKTSNRDKHRAQRPQKVFGALIVEQVDESWLKPLTAKRADLLAEHIAAVLHNANTHQNLFLLPFWRLLGGCCGWFRGRNWLKAAAAVTAIAAIVLTLALVPAPYRVEGTGKLMPVVQREVFAPWDANVMAIHVSSGQQVEPHQILLELRNDELGAELLAARSRLDEKRQLLSALQAEIEEANRRASRADETRLRGRFAQTNIEVRAAAERLESLEDQRERLTIRSPIAGTIATFQLDQLLLNRPVSRGEVLLEVMDESGPWELQIELPENRMGHLLQAQQARGTKNLPVEFVLATSPERNFRGELRETSTRTALSVERGTIVDLRVDVDADHLTHRRIGAEVQAKIVCGEKSLAYVLFGDLVEFLQRRFW